MEPEVPPLPPRREAPSLPDQKSVIPGQTTGVKATQQSASHPNKISHVGVFISKDGRHLEVKPKEAGNQTTEMVELQLKENGQIYSQEYLKENPMGRLDKNEYVLLDLKKIQADAPEGFVKVSKESLKQLTSVKSVSQKLCDEKGELNIGKLEYAAGDRKYETIAKRLYKDEIENPFISASDLTSIGKRPVEPGKFYPAEPEKPKT